MTPVLEQANVVQTTAALDQYVALLGAAEIDELRALAAPLEGATIQMVNSTAVGGGVAELLARLLPLMRELGLEPRWDVLEGGPDFFEVTKAFHNALHGRSCNITARDYEIFVEYTRRNREHLNLDARFMVMHDPQPARLIDARTKSESRHWI
jgi:trehalose synthase